MKRVSLDTLARRKFGYEALRPGQKEAVESVLAGRDTLAVMPTGSGKSAIYQMAAVVLPRANVVVSPLWGKGLVARYESGKIVVLFDEAGYKTFNLRMVQEQGLLQPLA